MGFIVLSLINTKLIVMSELKNRSHETAAATKFNMQKEEKRAAAEQTQEKESDQRRADFLAWAQEFTVPPAEDLQKWIDETFIFNTDGTVETKWSLDLVSCGLRRLPEGLSRVNGHLELDFNRLTSLKNLATEIRGDLRLLGCYQLASLDELQGKKIDGDLNLAAVPVQSIPEEIKLGGKVIVFTDQTALAQDARTKGYEVLEK